VDDPAFADRVVATKDFTGRGVGGGGGHRCGPEHDRHHDGTAGDAESSADRPHTTMVRSLPGRVRSIGDTRCVPKVTQPGHK